jgi:predicted DNA-binding transcriptional regulator AlpA
MPDTAKNNGHIGVLIGLDQIAEHIGCGRSKLVKLLAETNFPANKIAGTWYAHQENIDAWFRSATAPGRRPAGGIDAEEEEAL